MASLLEKVQILLAADLNRLVDRALQSNEPAVYEQHIRELQLMQEQLSGELASLRASITEMRRRSDEQQALATQQDREVDDLVRMGLQQDALASQDRLNQTRLQAAQATERVDRLESEYARLVETKALLDARITALQQGEPELNAARARRLADQANAKMDDLAGAPDAHDADTARLVESIRTRLAQAEAQVQTLEQRGLAHGETPEVLKRKELESQLEARKARLGLSEPPASQPAAAESPESPESPESTEPPAAPDSSPPAPAS